MANAVQILIQGKDQFSRPAQKAQASATGLRATMGGLGKTVLAVGAGFIAAQVGIAGAQKALSATIGAAIKFEAAMTKINTLVGISSDVTDEWTPKLLEIGRATAQGPVKLADALFVVTSAGLRGSESLDVLEAAAKASAVGMGATSEIARTVTAALQAFGDTGLTAARATDILVATVREGNLEASSLGGTLGRVLGPAAALGIKFEDLGAFIATYTRLGVSAEEATTGLLSVMNTMIKPTSQAAEALAEAGLSMEQVRKVATEKGLVAALALLNDKFGGNVEELGKVIPNVRALSGVLATAGAQGEEFAEIADNISNSVGILDEAFEGAAETTEFKLNQSMTDLNIALMKLGAEGLPVAVSFVQTLVNLLLAFEDVAAGIEAGLQAPGDALNDLTGQTEGSLLAVNKFKDEVLALGEAHKAAAGGIGETRREAARFDAGLKSLAETTGIDIELLKRTGLSIEEIREAFLNAGIPIIEFTGAVLGAQDQLGDLAGVAPIVADEIKKASEDMAGSLAGVEEAAADAKRTLLGLFRETTQGEADAELALANLQVEAGRLEAKTGDLTVAESARLDLLNGELIPAQKADLDLLRLEKDAVEKLTAAQQAGLPTWDEQIKRIATANTIAQSLTRSLLGIPSEVGVNVGINVTGQEILESLLVGPAIARQHGGPVAARQAVLVGETRPELFVPDQAGTILPNVGAAIGGRGGGGQEFHFHFHDPIVMGDEGTAMEWVQFILPELRRAI